MTTKKKVRFIKPRNILKEKAGRGGIAPELIKKAQDWVNDADFDYETLGAELIKEFADAIKTLKTEYDEQKSQSGKATQIKTFLSGVTAAIMQIKASGGMFQYPLLSKAANISLVFVEDLTAMTDDVFDVLNAHHRVLELMMTQNLRKADTPQAETLLNELQKVSQRYYKKHGYHQDT